MGLANDTMADVLDDLTQNDWDHVFVVNREGVPMGRIHAVDMLKIVAKKNVRKVCCVDVERLSKTTD